MIRLRYERLEQGYSQPMLSAASKVPQPMISLAETGKWNLDAEDLAALAKVLNVDPPEALLKPIEIVLKPVETVEEQSA